MPAEDAACFLFPDEVLETYCFDVAALARSDEPRPEIVELNADLGYFDEVCFAFAGVQERQRRDWQFLDCFD